MLRTSIGIAAAFGIPSIISVLIPRFMAACPSVVPESSLRSSATATRSERGTPIPSDKQRAQSLRNVVLPAPGAAAIIADKGMLPSKNLPMKRSAQPITSRGILILKLVTAVNRVTFPFS